MNTKNIVNDTSGLLEPGETIRTGASPEHRRGRNRAFVYLYVLAFAGALGMTLSSFTMYGFISLNVNIRPGLVFVTCVGLAVIPIIASIEAGLSYSAGKHKIARTLVAITVMQGLAFAFVPIIEIVSSDRVMRFGDTPFPWDSVMLTIVVFLNFLLGASVLVKVTQAISRLKLKGTTRNLEQVHLTDSEESKF